jgi:hypothetical protein
MFVLVFAFFICYYLLLLPVVERDRFLSDIFFGTSRGIDLRVGLSSNTGISLSGSTNKIRSLIVFSLANIRLVLLVLVVRARVKSSISSGIGSSIRARTSFYLFSGAVGSHRRLH